MSRIVSVAHYLPKMRVKTEDMLREIKPERYEICPYFIQEKIGIHEVRHSKDDVLPSELAIQASIKAFEKTNIRPEEIGVIIFCGIERDYVEPSTAHVVQYAIGATNATCFDVSNACLGFMTAMQLADNMIKAGTVSYVLICTGEKGSRISKTAIQTLKPGDYADYRNLIGAFTVGDSGAAAIIGPKESGLEIFGYNFYSQGQLAELCYYRFDKGAFYGRMLMKPICTEIIKAHKKIYSNSMKVLNWNPNDVDCLITHQVGRRVFDGFAKIFGIDKKKMTKTYNFLGNITSATFGVNLSLALEGNHLSKGDKVFIALTGSGLSVGQAGMIV